MMTLSKQRKFTFNSLLEDIRGSKCCEIKVRQYICSHQVLENLFQMKAKRRLFTEITPTFFYPTSMFFRKSHSL